jgi:hypothetical protein
MEFSSFELVPHPRLLDTLFAFKSKVLSVYREVLGIHEIDHIAITRINSHNEIQVLSSTPSMEFNLFSGSLWRYDKAYSRLWQALNTQDYWTNLYDTSRYDELYYLKQIKHAYPLGMSFAAMVDNQQLIYSLASHKDCANTRHLFATEQDDFYKIGHYCFKLLVPLFDQNDAWAPEPLLPLS